MSDRPSDYLSHSEWALDELHAIQKIFQVAIQGIRLCTLPENRDVISGQLRQGIGFKPELGSAADETAEQLIENAQALQSHDFAPLLRSAVLQSYSSFEFFLKALFVDFAEKNREAAAGLIRSFRVKVNAQLLLLQTDESRLFFLADEAWQQVQGKDFSERSFKYISEFCSSQLGNTVTDQVLPTYAPQLNEVHRLRVALAHHGGRIKGGGPVEIPPRRTVSRMLRDLNECAKKVHDLSPFCWRKQL